MIIPSCQPWSVRSSVPARFNLGRKLMIDLVTVFHHCLRNTHLRWSCRRRPRKARATGRGRQWNLDSSRRRLLGNQLRAAIEYHADIRPHETIGAALLQTGLSR